MRLSSCCALVLALAACSGDPAEPSTGTLSGLVSSPARGALADVAVTLDGGDRATTTDAEGRYAFADVAEGEHVIAVEPSQPGCLAPPTATVVQPENAPLVHDIAVECTPFGAVRGTLTGTHWGALPNVTIKGNGGALLAITDASGAFLLGGIVFGEVTMVVDGAPADCFSNPLVKSVSPGDTISVEWAMLCRGPELRFLRQIRQWWPNADSGTINSMHPYFSDNLSHQVRSLVVPYVGPGYANGRYPAWRFELAPDRSAVLATNDVDLYRIPMDGEAQMLVDEGNTGSDEYGAAYSPSGTEFINSVKYNQGSLAVMRDAGGGNPVDLNFRHRVFYSTAFAWHPGGMQILFQSNDYEGFVYHSGDWEAVPDPDDAHIWLMNRDGSGRTQLTTGAWRDIRPTWSPDGSQVGFLSDRGGSGFEPYVMEPDGSDQRPLPGNTYWIWASGELSPIGDVLTYAAETEIRTEAPNAGYGASSIYLANPDGSEPQLLNTGGTGADYSPYWVR